MTNLPKKPTASSGPIAPAEDISVAEDTRQKAGRAVNAPNAPRANASFDRWNAERGFGFLIMEDGRRAFCHVSELCSHLNPGRGNEPDLNAKIHVGQVVEGDKGLKARKVQCMDCITPAVWELRPDGPELWGVRKMKAVCVGKPNEPSYKSTIPSGQVYDANEPYRQAQAKERRWQGVLTPAFFEEFGEPEKTEVIDDNRVILSYPHGQKTVSAYSIFDSGHWKVMASGQWKKGAMDVSAEFVFEGLPGLSIMRQVGHSEHPAGLSKDFDLLPSEIQTEMLEHLRTIIPTAEGLAENRWESFSKIDYEQERMATLRNEIVELQAPGEIYQDSGSYMAQEEVTAHYGDETWGTGRHMDVRRTYWYLVTGARKSERQGGYGIHDTGYTGGNRFTINKPQEGQSVKKIRDAVMAEKQTVLEKAFDRVKNISPIPDELRLYDIQPETWMTRFKERIDELEKSLRKEWNAEDQTALAKMNDEWEKYNQLAETFKTVRDEFYEVNRRAGKVAVGLSELESPYLKEIDDATLEDLRQSIDEIKAYIPKAEAMISAGLQAREERRKAEEAQRKAEVEQRKAEAAKRLAEAGAAVQLEEGQDIDPKEIEFAEVGAALAKATLAQLGSPAAMELLEGEFNASYGRGRRQQAVMDRLGAPDDEILQKFFSYGRARDVNAVLEAALHFLQNTPTQTTTATPKEAPKPPAFKPAYTDTPAKPVEPAKPANMADLMGKFGKKR